MTLLKTSVLNGISVAVKICSAIIINKVLALYVGPSGYSTFGQFQNILTIVTSASGGVFLSGVTKETAENHNNSKLQHEVWGTSCRVTLVLALISGMILFVNTQWLERVFFPGGGDMWPLLLVAILLPCIALNSLFLSILIGMREISLYVLINIASNVVIGILGSILILNYGVNGGLVTLLLSPLIGTILLAFNIKSVGWLKIKYFLRPVNKKILISITKFSFMGITSAVMVPATAILIRSYIEKKFGISEAGYWQGVQKMGDIYTSIITMTLSVYYLPRIAEIKQSNNLKKEVLSVYKFILPISCIGAIGILLARDFIIETLFTPQFMVMRDLMPWQLLGDIMKVGSWVLAFIMVGRGMVKPYVVTEILFCILLYSLSLLMCQIYGVTGSVMAYAVCYLIYWLVMIWVIRSELKKMDV